MAGTRKPGFDGSQPPVWPVYALLVPVLCLSGFAVLGLVRDWRAARGEATMRSQEMAVEVARRIARFFDPAAERFATGPTPDRRPLPGFVIGKSNALVEPPPIVWPPVPQPLPPSGNAQIDTAWEAACDAVRLGEWNEAVRGFDRFLEIVAHFGSPASGSGEERTSPIRRRRRLAEYERALALERTGADSAALDALQHVVDRECQEDVATLTEAGLAVGCLAASRVVERFLKDPAPGGESWNVDLVRLARAFDRWPPVPYLAELAEGLERWMASPAGRNRWERPPSFLESVRNAETRRRRHANAMQSMGPGSLWPDDFWLNEPTPEWFVFRDAAEVAGPESSPEPVRSYRLLHEAWIRDAMKSVVTNLDRRGDLSVRLVLGGRGEVVGGEASRIWRPEEELAASRQAQAPAMPAFEVGVRLTNAEAFYAGHRRRLIGFGALLGGTMVTAGVATMATRRALWRQQQLNREKSNFVSSVSHELRAPLGSIRLLAEGLERGTVQTEDRRQEYFRLIGRETRRLGALVENVLDYSRIEQGRKRYEMESTDVASLVRDTVRLVERGAGSREVVIALSGIEGEATSTGAGVWELRVDGRAIQQALLNLVDNAMKHAPEGSTIQVGVTRGASAQGPGKRGWCRISVRDEGPGIPEEDQRRIFEPFYRRGSELRRETEGIGIGLSIVRHVVEAHDGHVEVVSEVGRGATFVLVLPVGDAEEPEETEASTPGGGA